MEDSWLKDISKQLETRDLLVESYSSEAILLALYMSMHTMAGSRALKDCPNVIPFKSILSFKNLCTLIQDLINFSSWSVNSHMPRINTVTTESFFAYVNNRGIYTHMRLHSTVEEPPRIKKKTLMENKFSSFKTMRGFRKYRLWRQEQ